MRIRSLILLAIPAYAISLALTLPASTALGWAPPLPVTLSGVEGRLLNGRAEALQAGPELRVQALRWQFAPAALIGGSLGAALDFLYLDGAGQAKVGVDWQGRLRISEGRLQIEAQRLAEALAIPLAEFDGTIEAQLDGAVWQQQALSELDGRLIWRRAGLRQPLQLALGEVRADLSGDAEQGFLARLSNAGGSISIDGDVRLQGQRLQADLRLRPLAGAPAEAGQLLAQIARRQSDGSYRVQRNLSLSQLR